MFNIDIQVGQYVYVIDLIWKISTNWVAEYYNVMRDTRSAIITTHKNEYTNFHIKPITIYYICVAYTKIFKTLILLYNFYQQIVNKALKLKQTKRM